MVEPIVPDAWFADPDVHDARTGARARPDAARAGAGSSSRPAARRSTSRAARCPGGKGRVVSIEDYERTLRPALIGSYARGGYCWVVIGSTQYGRAFAEPERGAERDRATTATLARHGDVVHRSSTRTATARGPVQFNFDWSFDYYPLAYERPGPTVVIYRLRAAPAGTKALQRLISASRMAAGTLSERAE